MNIIIKKIEEGMTGQQVADLLYENFLALIRKIEQFPEEFEDDMSHLIDKYIATLRGDLYRFIQTIFEECFGDEKFFKEMQELIDIYFNSQDIVNKLYDVINNLIDIYLSTGDMLEYIETIVIREVERIFENADDYPELVDAFKKYIREVIMGEYRGKPNGIASLDGNGKVPLSELPYSSDTQDGIITKEEHKLLNTTLPNRITTEEQARKDADTAINNSLSSVTNRVTAAENKLNVLNGNASVTGSVDQKVATAVTNLINGAPSAYDTLKEIADWIATSEADAADLLAKLNKLENEHDTDIKALQAVDNTLQTNINNEATARANKDTDLQNQINALKSKSDGIEAGAEANVQSDWNVTDTSSDAYIKNKPGNASQSVAGLMSAADKKKLDGIAAGANNSTVSFSAAYTEGIKIGTITINGTSTDIYIPIWNGTLAEYNAIATKKEDFIYNIIDDGSSDSGSGGNTGGDTGDSSGGGSGDATIERYGDWVLNLTFLDSSSVGAAGGTVTMNAACYRMVYYSDGTSHTSQTTNGIDVSCDIGSTSISNVTSSQLFSVTVPANTTGSARTITVTGSSEGVTETATISQSA